MRSCGEDGLVTKIWLAIYDVATSARLEVDRAVHVVEAAVSGRVIRAQTQIEALGPRHDAFQAEVEGVERALSEAHHTASKADCLLHGPCFKLLVIAHP